MGTVKLFRIETDRVTCSGSIFETVETFIANTFFLNKKISSRNVKKILCILLTSYRIATGNPSSRSARGHRLGYVSTRHHRCCCCRCSRCCCRCHCHSGVEVRVPIKVLVDEYPKVVDSILKVNRYEVNCKSNKKGS